jgi:hypothetical protein
MKKSILILYLPFLLIPAFAQLKKGQIDPSKVPMPTQHYQTEFTFDSSNDPARWTKQKPGLNVSFGSSDQLYMRSEVPLDKPLENWNDTGWRGERLNAQIPLWSPDSLKQIRFYLKDLTDGKGNSIEASNMKLNLVRYVISNYPYGSSNASCDVAANDTAYLMPDRFETFERFDLPGKTVRPVWLSLDIPEGTAAGYYSGEVVMKNEKQETVLQIKIKVQNQVMPKSAHWKFRLDLWQNPWVVAWYYQVEPWSEEHKILLKKHLKLYADTGGKFITTYAVNSPWSDNSYRIEGNMIEWLKLKDGSWKFDYGVFDQYVELSMEAGIREAITIYTPVPWGHRFRYMDESSGNYVYAVWPPDSPAFKDFWNIFLSDLKSHLEKKGWFEKTYLGINENPLNITMAAAHVIKEHSKNWKITYAGEWHPELSSLLDDYSLILTSEPSPKELKERRAKGFTTTYYVCCTPPKPNNFLFSPPIEGRFISWYSAAYGYDGFLRWAFDAWPEDPMRDARHTLWPAGDCFMVYPGGNSGIRHEKLREGIVDFEKIRILRELVAKSPDRKIKALWNTFEAHLTNFIDNRDYNKRDYSTEKITRLVHQGKELIEQLSDELTSSR